MKRAVTLAGVLLTMLLPLSGAYGHEVRPGFLELRETEGNMFLMLWKVPALGAFRLGIEPRLPEFCQFVGEPTSMQTGGAFVERGRIRCEHDVRGEKIAIRGLDATMTDVLVRFETIDGMVQNVLLTPSAPAFVVASAPNRLVVFATYLRLGVEHILTGTDHLLFVLCLLMLVRSVGKLLATVTAFTLAHSITLGAATLGFINVPSPPVEATIALSIVFLASELLRDEAGRSDVTRYYPWLVAFSFGLLHGLGFAGALAEIGLPHGEIPLALFAFNVGVEIGQLTFIGATLTIIRVARMFVPYVPASMQRVAGYAIGSIASFWVFERLAAAM